MPVTDETAHEHGSPPRMLHHLAHVTHDVPATVDFYTRVLRMKLVSSVIDDAVPSTGDPFPYIHLFFQMADGSMIAFFESIDLPPPAPATHPAYGIFNHIALEAGSVEEVDRWAEHLRREGVEYVGPVEHGVIYSIYFYDPNGLRLELTSDVTVNWKQEGASAAEDVAAWEELKARSRRDGNSEALVEWIKERRLRRPGENP